jgi:surface antigen
MYQSNKIHYLVVVCLSLISLSSHAQGNLSGIGALNSMTGAMQGFARGMAENDARNAAIQQYTEACRASMDPRLLPLTSECISTTTQRIILSTLNTSLEMDASNGVRAWANNEKGSSGYIVMKGDNSSRYGQPCRNFEILFDFEGERKSTTGTACRSASGVWNWL